MKNLIPLALLGCLLFLACNGDCDLGYEGDGCNTESRAKFVGLWSTSNYNCDMGNSTSDFTYDISQGELVNEIILTSVSNPDLKLKGQVTGTTISIPSQDFDFGVELTYAGSGSISGNQLTLTTTRDADGFVQTCAGDYTK